MGAWQNWAGNVSCRPAAIRQPASTAEIQAIVREAAASGGGVRVAGAGHSFTPLVATEGTLLTLERHAGLVSVDAARHQATVLAGTRLAELGRLLDGHGLAQANLGDINVQTVAGAISTGTHGTGAELGSVSTQLVGLTLVTGRGELLECSESVEPEVFKAAQVSLGALGVIDRVTLQLQPSYRLHLRKDVLGLEACLADLERHKRENRHFEFFWFPHADRVATKAMNLTADAPRGRGPAAFLDEVVLENVGFGLLNELCRVVPALSPAATRVAAATMSRSEAIDASHRLFATPRHVKFVEMEYNLPAERAVAVLEEIRAAFRRERFEVSFPIEVRFARADDTFLGPASGRASCYVAVHAYRGMAFKAYFDAMEAIFLRHEGRPHWGKLHSLAARELAERYPHWERFQAVRRALDPDGVFLTPYMRRLLVGD